ncbi:hypothetical protein SBA3_1330010 [Candidatus Sulfopaludibacter sp. SbA3]|nr:hypothetical protein SBA3_1330010 [Candidatus Sulfopaludibacter sp. SbA3]
MQIVARFNVLSNSFVQTSTHDASVDNEIIIWNASQPMNTSTPTVLLFSYGTLQKKACRLPASAVS